MAVGGSRAHCGRLDLNPQQPPARLGDEVGVGTMAQRHPDSCAVVSPPFDRGGLSEVALLAPVDESLRLAPVSYGSIHDLNVRSPADGSASECGESCTQRGLREPVEPLTYGMRRNRHMHEHP